jgi:ABC-2 type transport system ATP-binding protein
MDETIEHSKKYAKERGKEMDKTVRMMDDWSHCDGYVKSVETAIIAMMISCVVSLMLILTIERIKLLFYQSSEKSYEVSDDISLNDKSKFL